jgi:hypothetical protein
MFQLGMRTPLFTILPQFFLLPNNILSEKVVILCRLPFIRSVQSFELDENLILYERFVNDQSYFDQLKRVTHLRISLWSFDQCVDLLSQLGSQLHSFIVTIVVVSDKQIDLISKIKSVSKIF